MSQYYWLDGHDRGGTGSKDTLAAGTASAKYVQSELQGALNRVAALEARLKSYDIALIGHGLIGT
jgi:hypothetical protein